MTSPFSFTFPDCSSYETGQSEDGRAGIKRNQIALINLFRTRIRKSFAIANDLTTSGLKPPLLKNKKKIIRKKGTEMIGKKML